jgi:ribonuclease VapC
MAVVVLDASAILALLRNEPGADIVEGVIGAGVISAVNLHEVWKELLSSGIPAEIAREIADELRFEVRAHDSEAAWRAAQLHEATRSAGSGLGDRACMALAISEGVPALTADKAWKKVKVEGLTVELIR